MSRRWFHWRIAWRLLTSPGRGDNRLGIKTVGVEKTDDMPTSGGVNAFTTGDPFWGQIYLKLV